MSDFCSVFPSIHSILHISRRVAWAVTSYQLLLQGSTYAAYRALHAICRRPMLVLVLVLPLPICDTECAIFSLFLIYIFCNSSRRLDAIHKHHVKSLSLGCSLCQAFPRKIPPDLLLPLHDNDIIRDLVLIGHY